MTPIKPAQPVINKVFFIFLFDFINIVVSTGVRNVGNLKPYCKINLFVLLFQI